MYYKEWERIKCALEQNLPEMKNLHYVGSISDDLPKITSWKPTYSDADYEDGATLRLMANITDAGSVATCVDAVNQRLELLGYSLTTKAFCHADNENPITLEAYFQREISMEKVTFDLE